MIPRADLDSCTTMVELSLSLVNPALFIGFINTFKPDPLLPLLAISHTVWVALNISALRLVGLAHFAARNRKGSDPARAVPSKCSTSGTKFATWHR